MEKLIIDQLKALYDAEKQLIKALPKMARAASDEELSTGFRSHADQTRQQAQRIEQMFQALGVKAKSTPCGSMTALVEEGQQIIASDMDDSVRDLALVAAARRVEHYEMAAY